MSIEPQRIREILLVEDDPTDVLLTREALRAAHVVVNLRVVGDGVEAMDFLRRQGQYLTAPRPDLVLLDLNLPRKDGCEVLTELKADPRLRRIPVIVMSTSTAPAHVLRVYELHGNCYLAKADSFTGFTEVMKSLEQFWLRCAVLPRE